VHEQIAANKRKTVLLFIAAITFTALIGYAIGFLFFQGGVVGVVLATILAVALSLGSYFAGDRIVLASTGARGVTAEQEPRLHNIVEGIAIAAGVPKPRVYVVPEQAPNAFATGRNPEHSSIAVTQGLLDTMNRVELEGVIGHEMSHVLDRDILVGTVFATVVGEAVLMSEFFMRSWFWSG
jgi:heat shock protein HtpX